MEQVRDFFIDVNVVLDTNKQTYVLKGRYYTYEEALTAIREFQSSHNDI